MKLKLSTYLISIKLIHICSHKFTFICNGWFFQIYLHCVNISFTFRICQKTAYITHKLAFFPEFSIPDHLLRTYHHEIGTDKSWSQIKILINRAVTLYVIPYLCSRELGKMSKYQSFFSMGIFLQFLLWHIYCLLYRSHNSAVQLSGSKNRSQLE